MIHRGSRIEAGNDTNRRAPIPRPWLSKKRPLSNDYLDGRFDILDKPHWSISWDKLSTCFCLRDQSKDHRHHENVPFPAFPALRRNSFSSFSSGDYYPSDGSVSSFTESDTSSSSSLYEEEFERHQQPVRRPSTPPPAPVSKPQTVTTRSRSVGLPPLVSSSSVNTPQQPMARSRCDTGNFSGASNTTNTSRHRRKKNYQFSPQSIEQIWRGSDDGVVPPSFVVCEDDRNDSGYVSSLDPEDDWGVYEGDRDFDRSPFPKLERRIPKSNDWRNQKPPKSIRRSKTKEEEPTLVPVYLRKNPDLDNATDGNLVVSGWTAVSFGPDSSLERKLQEGSKSKVKASDIYYLRIVEGDGKASILLQNSDGTVKRSFPLEREWTCDSQEITSRVGRCVTVRSPTGIVVTMLPVSLDDGFFPTGKLVSSKDFSRIHDRLFVSGRGKVYAPDSQHDAAMFIMFSLDALIKNCGR